MLRTTVYLILVMLPVLASAEPFTLGTMATIAAISALAQAGGAAMSAYGASKEGKANRRLQEQFHKDEMENTAAGRALQARQIDLEERKYREARPGNALQMISGLQDLSEKRARSGGYLDTVRALARR